MGEIVPTASVFLPGCMPPLLLEKQSGEGRAVSWVLNRVARNRGVEMEVPGEANEFAQGRTPFGAWQGISVGQSRGWLMSSDS